MSLAQFLSQEEIATYAIDWNGPIPSQEWGTSSDWNEQGIIVPEITSPFANERFDERLSHLIHESDSSNFGVDAYERVLEFVLNYQE